ncbi:hypothetical protein [Roseateles oligotrophus]|uniref:Uncharacterized protein n=1 Tax=Roseateles oligotrophus TaxID=1769250 RepID=A0ABT2YEZ2_9BURK|nr:hypothetical protein [Roseateles oligotrophus]MCV2368621.1 hypothetical protein [Roseateles oligotrophus]
MPLRSVSIEQGASAAERQTLRETWNAAFRRAYSEPWAQTMHRAASSGQAPELAAARRVQLVCVASYMPAQVRGKWPKASEADLRRAEALERHCDAQGQYRQLTSQLTAAARSLPTSTVASRLAGKDQEPLDVQARLEVMRYALSTGSAPLLDYAASKFASPEVLIQLGLTPNPKLPAEFDLHLVQWAASVMACEEMGNCGSETLQSNSCLDTDDCVANFADYPAMHIYGPNRKGGFFLTYRSIDIAQTKARWDLVKAWAQAQLSASL